MNYGDLVEPLVTLARTAGDAILEVYATDFDVQAKDDASPLTQADMASHHVIDAGLKALTPDIPVISEESGLPPFTERSQWPVYWLIDPLDGTTNFIHGFPQFAVSIAVLKDRTIEHGVVYDPLRNELFTASRGQGAQLNERRIRVSSCAHLETALLGTGFPFRELDRLDQWTKTFRMLTRRSAGIRRTGSAALDLAYVAAGRMDGFWEFGLKVWDMAAGALLIREAGGLISDPEGGQDFLDTGDVVTANPRIFNEFLRTVARHQT